MEDLLNNLDSLESETNNVQNIVNANYQVRLEMMDMMMDIINIISLIQTELDKLENVQDAAKDVAELKGKITQNKAKQAELLTKMQTLKQVLEKSPNITELQAKLNTIKQSLANDILNHQRLQEQSPGNSPNQTRLGAIVAPTPEQRGMSPPRPDPRGDDLLGGYRYSGNSPGKIIRTISRTRTKKKKNKTKRKRI